LGKDIDGINNKANDGVCEDNLGRTCKVRKLSSKKTDKKKYPKEMGVTRVGNRWNNENIQGECIDRKSTIVIHQQVPESIILRK
jgi:hypothetical protein